MTKVEIIEETAAFYNSGNRAITVKGDCVYETTDGKKCAVGRVLKEGFIPYRNNNYSIGMLFEDNKNDEKLFLKEQYYGHNLEFWSSLQNFHDVESNWNENGISIAGMIRKDNLINLYDKS